MQKAAAAPTSGVGELLAATQLGDNKQAVHDSVKEYYGEVGGCWCGGRAPSPRAAPCGRAA